MIPFDVRPAVLDQSGRHADWPEVTPVDPWPARYAARPDARRRRARLACRPVSLADVDRHSLIGLRTHWDSHYEISLGDGHSWRGASAARQ
jgi:hypothetical protein